jgi:hypothetical protein
LAVFLWIPLNDVADPEFLREFEDSDFADLAARLFFFGFTPSFYESCFLLLEPCLEESL